MKQKLKAPISEIFFSYQGEGLYIGKPQIFIRFAGCNLSCDYCDTTKNRSAGKAQQLTVDQVIGKIKKTLSAARSPLSSISITGGEPLLYKDFLRELLPKLKKSGFEVYLETNGTLSASYKKISRFVDATAMDIKLPSETRKNNWRRHFSFLKLLPKNSFIKIILTAAATEKEIKKAVAIIKKAAPNIPVVFQPATPRDGVKTVEPEKLYKFLRIARRHLKNVTVTPQLHKLLWRIK